MEYNVAIKIITMYKDHLIILNMLTMFNIHNIKYENQDRKEASHIL